MTLHVPILIGPGVGDPTVYATQQEFRNFITSLVQIPTGFPNAEGIIGPNSLAVTQHGAGNMSVDVGGGTALVVDNDITAGGTYWVWNDATFNLTVPTAPGSGTENHRIVLQLRNKGENGSWSTYDFIPMLLADTGGGTQAEPGSAITLAIVAVTHGQVSVLNANITDWRKRVDKIVVSKAGTTTSTSASFADDPDLQLTGLQPNALYHLSGLILYEGSSATNFRWTFREQNIVNCRYAPIYYGPSGGVPPLQMGSTPSTTGSVSNGLDNVQAATAINFGGFQMAVSLQGVISTGAVGNGPPFMVFQFSNSAGGGQLVQVDALSYLVAERFA